MKTWKSLLLLCLTLALLAIAVPAMAAEELREGIFTYTVADGAATITGADPTEEPLIIPETIGGYPVKKIGYFVFDEAHHEPYAVIPACVETIERGAFYYTRIDTFYIYGKNTRSGGNFSIHSPTVYCHEDAAIIEELDRANAIIYLEDYPCDPRSLVPIQAGAYEYALYDGEAILLKCTLEGEFTVPDMLGNCPVTYIGPECFQGGSYVCTLPDSVRSIGYDAFCSFLVTPENTPQDRVLTGLPKNLKRISTQGIRDITLLDGVFPNGLERISGYGCMYLNAEKIVIPGTVKSLDEQAFHCASIKEIVLEDGVETIQQYAFEGMQGLSLTVPASVTQCGYLGTNDELTVYGYVNTVIFEYCGDFATPFIDLETGQLYDKPYFIEEGTIKYRIYPHRCAEVYDLLPGHPDALVIPETVAGLPVTYIGNSAIASETVTSVYVPDTVTDIFGHGFFHCPNLRNVRLSENLETIGDGCFGLCPELKAIYLAPSVTSIGDSLGDDNRTLIIAGREGSCAEAYAKEFRYPFVKTEEGKEYIIENDGVYRKDDEGAVLVGFSCVEVDHTYCYCEIPNEAGGCPIVGIDADAVFAGIRDIKELYLGSNVRFIEEGALTDTEIATLYTTPTLEELPVPLFAGEGEIYGVSGTYAESYAKEHNIFFYPYDGTPFTDVPEDSWFFPSVYFCYWSGLMNGTSQTTFNPTGTSSRAMLVTTLYRMCGEPYPDGESDYFLDVPEYTWYTSAVDWAAEYGVVYGTSAYTFSPNDPVTREQVATILYRLGNLLGEDVATYSPLTGFNDADKVSDYAKTALMWAVDAGILQGTDKNMLNPKGATTRAEMATILLRYIAWLEA